MSEFRCMGLVGDCREEGEKMGEIVDGHAVGCNVEEFVQGMSDVCRRTFHRIRSKLSMRKTRLKRTRPPQSPTHEAKKFISGMLNSFRSHHDEIHTRLAIKRNRLKDNRSAVLTSHSMEECEALCTRLSIMVNGQLGCLGGPQQIKNKFGDGYTVTLRAHAHSLFTAVAYVTKVFRRALIKERHYNTAEIAIPLADTNLAEIFELLEKAKSELGIIQDYSVTQTTLDQVFLNFCRAEEEEQERLQSDTSHSFVQQTVSTVHNDKIVYPSNYKLDLLSEKPNSRDHLPPVPQHPPASSFGSAITVDPKLPARPLKMASGSLGELTSSITHSSTSDITVLAQQRTRDQAKALTTQQLQQLL